MSRSAVITGLGVLSGCGAGPESYWNQLCAGTSAIKPVSRFNAGAFPCRLASEVPAGIGAKDYVPKSYRKAVKVMARDTELAVVAASLAVKDAGLTTRIHAGDNPDSITPTYPSARLGCQIGAGLLPAEVPELAAAFVTARLPDPSPQDIKERNGFSVRAWGTIATKDAPNPVGGMNNLPPLWLLKYLPNMLACHVTILHGAEGPSNTLTCSEASGLLSIGESCRVLERDAADICFSGGAESKVNLMGTLRSQLLGRLAPTNPQEQPADVLRPFDPASRGAIQGEGAGILMIEEASCASRRGARTYARIAGFGAAQSLSGLPLPGVAKALGASAKPPHRGMVLAIRAALKDAAISPDQIDLIIPQAIGVPACDASELLALREVFGPRVSGIPALILTPLIGDCAAGAGGLAAAAAALCLHHQQLPPHTLLADRPSRAPARAARLRHALVYCGSLGGQNAALVLSSIN